MQKIVIKYPAVRKKICDKIYGHFSEHIGGVVYGGLYVGADSDIPNDNGFRTDIMELLRKIDIPVLRWPGGCFAEHYNWRDGIGDKANRPVTVNFWYANDGKLETNQVGTHEFAEYCEKIGAEPYFAANCTESTVLEVRNWVEYCTFDRQTTLTKLRAANGREKPFRINFWGLGNECWGDGGKMTGDYYANLYKNYAESVRRIKKDSYLVACGPSDNDTAWTESFFRQAFASYQAPQISAFGMHYYSIGGGDCLNFNEEEWYRLIFNSQKIETYILEHRAIMDRYDPDRKIDLVVDEWGNWHPVGSGPSKGANLFEQQNTLRDAVVAASTLNIFNNRCDVIKMANLAQVCNNLHSLFLTAGEKLIVTPTYYVFEMMKYHQNAELLSVEKDSAKIGINDVEKIEKLNISASERDGYTLVSVVNTSYRESETVEFELSGKVFDGVVTEKCLTGKPNAYNDRDKAIVKPIETSLNVDNGILSVDLPAASVTTLRFKTK